ncbi:alpha/beta fold hydrolase [Kordiimonas pumila]|uniref:Alpha/beta fold hydrolase n=1 Tax=Kordiimonas pumila TaxID=2161677 RepID=A0ABV7DAR7_9PROT|nr:alpha/beta hydrolase [Kordiimonas pumila]
MTDTKPWHSHTDGSGPCSIIWLHGWGGDHKALGRIATLFNASCKNTLYDLPGFGKTPLLPEAHVSTRDYANALALQLRDGDKHIIIGHSYGARVAVQVAAAYPEHVAGIILISGAGLKRRRSLFFKIKASMLKLMGKAARLVDKLFWTTLYDAYSNRFGSKDYKNSGALRPVLVSAVTEDLSMIAKNIRCPALLVYGSDDVDTPPEIGRRYESLIPIARYEELKGYNHHDILTRGAYQCESLIRTFLKDLSKL